MSRLLSLVRHVRLFEPLSWRCEIEATGVLERRLAEINAESSINTYYEIRP